MSQLILGTSSGMGMILWIVVLFAMMYFLMIRPQKKQQDRHKQMLNNLKPNDRILTVGGLTGYVRQVSDSYIYVEIADGLVVEFNKQYVASVLQDDEDEEEAVADEPEAIAEADTKAADDAAEEKK